MIGLLPKRIDLLQYMLSSAGYSKLTFSLTPLIFWKICLMIGSIFPYNISFCISSENGRSRAKWLAYLCGQATSDVLAVYRRWYGVLFICFQVQIIAGTSCYFGRYGNILVSVSDILKFIIAIFGISSCIFITSLRL